MKTECPNTVYHANVRDGIEPDGNCDYCRKTKIYTYRCPRCGLTKKATELCCWKVPVEMGNGSVNHEAEKADTEAQDRAMSQDG